MDVTYLSDILKKVSEKSMDVDTALESLKHLPYEDIAMPILISTEIFAPERQR